MKNMIDSYKKIQSEIMNNWFKSDFSNYKYYIQKDVENKTVYLANSTYIVKMPLQCLAVADCTVKPMERLKEIYQEAEHINDDDVISEMSQDINGTTHIILTSKDSVTHIDEKFRKLFPDKISYKITTDRLKPVTLYFNGQSVAVIFPIQFEG